MSRVNPPNGPITGPAGQPARPSRSPPNPSRTPRRSRVVSNAPATTRASPIDPTQAARVANVTGLYVVPGLRDGGIGTATLIQRI